MSKHLQKHRRSFNLLFLNLPEGKVDSGKHFPGCFGYLMLPIGIGMSCHKKKGAMMQGDFNLGNIFQEFMAQAKQPCFPKGYRGNVHVLVGACGFVAVPAHAVTAVPVEVEQHGIELNTGMLLHALPDLKQLCRPVGIWPAFGPSCLSLPGDHPGGGDHFVVHGHFIFPPLGIMI